MMYLKGLIIHIFAAIMFCESYKILLVFPIPFKSHGIMGESLVSYITPGPVASHPNLSQIIIKRYDFIDFHFKKQHGRPKTFKDMFNETFTVASATLRDINVQQLMEDATQTFDLVIAEWVHNELYSGFSALFNCPYIWFFTFHNDHEILRLIHEAPNPLLITNTRTNNVPPLNFQQRAQEMFYLLTFQTWKYFHYNPIEINTYEELFGPIFTKRGRTLPSYESLRYNASLAFVNSHFTVRDSPIIPQNYKTIGGFHILGTSEELSQELLSIIEDSENGIILFSLGSYLKAEDMSSSMNRDLHAMFSNLNYTVLWKIDEQFKNQSANVKTFSWIPLQGVLAHPRCVLFITHGGILSLTESVHYGVPMVGVPVFADQTVNVKTAVKRGVARMVSIGPKLADDLSEAIEDLLRNPRYKENMKSLSSLYHDRPMSPGLELVYWVEHVVATRGALHQRSPALSVPWYQKIYADLAPVLLVLLYSFVVIVNKIIVYIVDKISRFIEHKFKIIDKQVDKNKKSK